MRSLWCDPVSEYKDEFYELPACRQYPKPVQQPHPPIHFGGESDAALRRVADLGQGWYGFNLDPAGAPSASRGSHLARRRGRTRGDVSVSVSPYLKPLRDGDVARYRDAGVDQLVLSASPFSSTDDAEPVLDRLATLIPGAG